MTTRIDTKFAALKTEGRPALVTYFMGGDPDLETSLKVMKELPKAGADVIELGMAFSDPMADGPAIEAAGLRALKAGQSLSKTLYMAAEFRKEDDTTPIVLMGYYNPIYIYGVERFLTDAKASGVDGLIIVDLPSEMDAELCVPAMKAGINFIRLTTPGFVYYVSMNGITGSAIADTARVGDAVRHIKKSTDLPICVGFGVKTPEQAAAIAAHADGVVVGTAIVNAVAGELTPEGALKGDPVAAVSKLVGALAQSVHTTRLEAAQ